jgi:sugar lactone lactonase YvrE
MGSKVGNLGRCRRDRIRLTIITVILLLALLQRLSAACQLPVDADESVYAWAASYYAGLMAHGEWSEIPRYTYNIEHPVFAKLLYAAGLWAVGHTGLPGQAEEPPHRGFLEWGDDSASLGPYRVDRLLSVLFGTLQVLVLALVDPLSGLLLAIHTMTIKYTSEAYLEAVPAFAITFSLLAYERTRRQRQRHTDGWFWLSAGLLGVAAASKYTYAVVGLAMVPFIVWQQRRKPWNVLLYGFLALAVFFVLDPILWPDPVGRLWESIRFHSNYARSAEVIRYDRPWWQPLNWMSGAAAWHPVFWFPFDLLIFLLSLVGLPFLFRQNKLYFAWFVVGWAFLFLWPTKWPQYTLIVVPAICLSVGALGREVVHRYDLRLDRETWERITYYLPDRTFWIAPSKKLLVGVAVLVGLYAVGYVGYRINRIRQRQGWTTYTVLENRLADDAITALALDHTGSVWIGTQRGLSVYGHENDQPVFHNADGSDLADDHVVALTLDNDGRMWVGTETGVSVYDAGSWTNFAPEDMGLPETRVRALTADQHGQVWVGTLDGAALWNGVTWQAFSPMEAGLTSKAVLALAVDTEGLVWMGTDRGLATLDLSGEGLAWTTHAAFSSGLPSNSIKVLLADPQGGVWVGTDGGGLCRLGDEWECYRTANSDLPWNTVVVLTFDAKGQIWAATETPTGVGGAVVSFSGELWREYTSRNSGLASDVVTAILQDREGCYWFGTQLDGVSVYEGRSVDE